MARSRSPVLEPAPDLPQHVGLPFRMRSDPCFQLRLQIAQRQVPMGGFAKFRRRIGQCAPGMAEFRRTEGYSASLALIAVRAFISAGRARSRHKAVGQKNLGFGVVQLLFGFQSEKSFFREAAKKILTGFPMHVGGGSPVVIEAHPETLETVANHRVILVHDVLRGNAFPVRPHHDGHAEFVGPAYVQHVPPLHALITHIQIGGQIRSREMPQMKRTVGVRKRRRNKNTVEIARRHKGML